MQWPAHNNYPSERDGAAAAIIIFRLAAWLIFAFCLSCSDHRDNPAIELIANNQMIQRIVVLEVPRTVSTQKGSSSDALVAPSNNPGNQLRLPCPIVRSGTRPSPLVQFHIERSRPIMRCRASTSG